MSGEEITQTLRAEDTTCVDELVAAGVEVSQTERQVVLGLNTLLGRSCIRHPCLLPCSVGRVDHAMPTIWGGHHLSWM
jgi:hypothetical protein